MMSNVVKGGTKDNGPMKVGETIIWRGKQTKNEVRRKTGALRINVWILSGHIGVAKEFVLLGCGAVSPGNQLPTFRRIAVTASSTVEYIALPRNVEIAVISQKNGALKRI
jgi:hypothetical protein